MSQQIKTEIKDSIAYLGLERPEKANAYNQSMLTEIWQFLDSIYLQDTVRALIIHGGSSKHFCAGADREEIRSRRPEDAVKLLSRMIFQTIAAFPHPTLAAVSGSAMGGGLELALACDIRIGASNSSFGFPETSLGIIPAAGGCTRLPRLASPTLAKEMILFERILNAQEAKQYGLLSEVVEPEQVLATAEKWAKKALKHKPLVNMLAKRAIDIAIPAGEASYYEEAAQAALYGQLAIVAPTVSMEEAEKECETDGSCHHLAPAEEYVPRNSIKIRI